MYNVHAMDMYINVHALNSEITHFTNSHKTLKICTQEQNTGCRHFWKSASNRSYSPTSVIGAGWPGTVWLISGVEVCIGRH